jgi:hypothetical protein
MDFLVEFMQNSLKLCEKYKDDRGIAIGFFHQAYGAGVYEEMKAIHEGEFEKAKEIESLWSEWKERFEEVLYGE